MIAKISHGTRIYGALLYNHTKVLQNKGAILGMHNMFESPDGSYTTGQLLTSFLPYLVANKKTEKTALHVSLNPDPNDIVSDEDYIRIAGEYMNKMGYGDQPYIVFRHNDIDRSHIHIVSTTVDKNGNKIPDSFEKKRSMEICRQIENKYNLTTVTYKQQVADEALFQPVDITRGNIKSQIASIVRYLPKYYGFQTLGAYNALLSLFNITAEHIKKEDNNEIKEGLVYFALGADGNKASNPFKSSLFGKQAGLSALKIHFEESKIKTAESKAATARMIVEAMKRAPNETDFRNYLIQKGINLVIRRNEDGRLFGVTFIDHNTRHVFNGSQLGKQFSANAFHEWFSTSSAQGKDNKINRKTLKTSIDQPIRDTKTDVHPIFDFMVNLSNMGDFGFLSSLLLENPSEDPEEQAFEFHMKKKRKKRNT